MATIEKYDIIYADPPWSYRGREQFGWKGDVGVSSGGSFAHYKTMTVEEIKGEPVSQITADNALLFLWIPAPLLPDGLAVMAAWGFTYATKAFTWYKQRCNPGYYTLSETEDCYAGKRGRIPLPRGSRKERQFVSQLRGKHSCKPDEIRNRITRMFPTQRKIELFARKFAAGWDAHGNEIPGGAKLTQCGLEQLIGGEYEGRNNHSPRG